MRFWPMPVPRRTALALVRAARTGEDDRAASGFGRRQADSETAARESCMSPSDKPPAATPVPGGKTVLVEFDSGIAWVTMNRPEKRNAISPALAAEMLAVVDALETDPRCGVLVLTGAGESFSAGMDLKEYFRATDGMEPEERAQIFRVNAT